MRIGPTTRQRSAPGEALLARWPFLLACLLGGVLLAVGVVLARPPVYQAQVTVDLAPQRYDFVDTEAGWALLEQEARAFLALQAPADLRSSSRVGQPAEFRRAGSGRLLAIGRATDPARAQEIATHGANALAEATRSIYGWNLLRTLLRRTIYLQALGRPDPPSLLTPHLFDLLEARFLAYDPSIPVADQPPALSTQDVADITLALQRMDDRYSAQIDLLFERRAQEQDAGEVAQIEEEIAALNWRRERLREALITLYQEGEELVDVAPGPAPPQVGQPEGPGESSDGVPRWAFPLIGAGAGLVLGAALALLDASFSLRARLGEVAAYRELIWNLVLRDLKARYKSSILGYLWSLVNPLLLMIVFTILFKYLLKSEIPNFPVFIIVALLPWNYCATAVSGSVVSITGQSNLIKKVYFPREAIPVAVVIANLINFLLALPAMLAIMAFLNAQFEWVALIFPLIVLTQTIFLLGLGLFLSCLNVFFRDTEVIMEVLLMAWFFLTPIFYRLSDIVDARLARVVRWVNPMASLVDFYRDIFYYGGMPGWDAIIRTFVTALLVFLVGYLFFLRFSPRFGEEV